MSLSLSSAWKALDGALITPTLRIIAAGEPSPPDADADAEESSQFVLTPGCPLRADEANNAPCELTSESVVMRRG